MDAMAQLRLRLRQVVGSHAMVYRPPRRSAIVGSVDAAGREGDVDTVRVPGIELDRVQRETALRRLPARSGRVLVQRPDRRPARAQVAAHEQTRRLDAGVQNVRCVRMARRQVPDRVQLARRLTRAGGHRQVRPARASVVGPVDVGPPDRVVGGREAPPGCPRIQHGVVDLVAGKVGSLESPVAASRVRPGPEEPLPSADQEDDIGVARRTAWHGVGETRFGQGIRYASNALRLFGDPHGRKRPGSSGRDRVERAGEKGGPGRSLRERVGGPGSRAPGRVESRGGAVDGFDGKRTSVPEGRSAAADDALARHRDARGRRRVSVVHTAVLGAPRMAGRRGPATPRALHDLHRHALAARE